MFLAPARRKMAITRLRRAAMIRGLSSARTWERSSSKSRSRTQCSRSSTPQWPGMLAASRAGLACVTPSEVTAWQVSRDHLPLTLRRRVIWMAWAACGKARPRAAAVTLRARRSVRPCPRSRPVMGHPYVAPGQGSELGMQAGLVALHQQVARAAAAQVGRGHAGRAGRRR